MSSRIKVILNGVDVPGDVTLKGIRGSAAIVQQIGVSTADFILRSTDATVRPAIGSDIRIEEDEDGDLTRAFAGRIISVVEDVRPETGWRDHKLTCADYTWITRKRGTGERVYTNQQRNDIIRNLRDECLDGEDLYIDDIPAGEGGLIKNLTLTFGNVGQAFDELAKLTGCIWYVDYFGQIQFVAELQPTARFVIGDDEHDILHPKVGRGAISLEQTVEETANRIVVRFGKTAIGTVTETFDSGSVQNLNGSRNNFQLANEVASLTSVRVDGVPESFGIDNVDTGRNWYWSEGSKQINQDSGGTPLTSAQTLEFVYEGLAYSALYRQDDDHIADYGVLDKVVDVSGSTTLAATEETADALIDALAQNTYSLTFATKLRGDDAPHVGDRIDLSRTGYPAVANLVVKSVRLTPSGQAPEAFWRVVNATRGPKLKDGQALLSSGTISGSAASGSASSGSGPSSGPWYEVPYSSTIDIQEANGTKQQVTLSGDVTINASGWDDGDELLLAIINDGSGRYKATFSSDWRTPAGFEIDPETTGKTYLRIAHVHGKLTVFSAQLYD